MSSLSTSGAGINNASRLAVDLLLPMNLLQSSLGIAMWHPPTSTHYDADSGRESLCGCDRRLHLYTEQPARAKVHSPMLIGTE